MQKSVLSARKFGFKKLYLESLPQFFKAVSIYEKQGFTRLNHPLGNSGHKTCNIWMLKELK
jgi:putative acetyltransferase